MNRHNLFLSLSAILVLCGLLAHGQEAAPPTTPDAQAAKPAKPQFFAGTVLEADATHVKVSRTLLGRPTETRVFAVDQKTKAPKGGIKEKSRVTVRYQHMYDHDLALEIQVRSNVRSPKNG